MASQCFCNCSPKAQLARVELSPGLLAQCCEACGGALLAMDDYRQWRSREPAEAGVENTSEFSDSPSARNCPGCARLMNRYRVGASPDFRVDHCHHCQLVWLDRGEWAALVKAGLSLRLSEIVSAAWQRRVQSDELRAKREVTLRERHGDACIDEIIRIRAWLEDQGQREELIALLRAGW